MTRVAAVTGARGFLGSRLVRHLRGAGWRVLELRRDGAGGDDAHPFTLDGPWPVEVLRGVDLLLHAAYDPRPVEWDDIRRVNVEGSRALFDAAVAAGVRNAVHVSTMSSFEGCRSLYGRAKLDTERLAAERGFRVVRPGLVYGRDAGGTVGALTRLVRLSPLLPLVGSGRHELYLVHVEDLCRLIVELGDADGTEPVVAAHERPLRFVEILRTLARAQGRRVLFLPVPWRLIWLKLRVLEGLGLRVGFRADSVLSLVNQQAGPDFSATRNLSTPLRAFDEQTALD
ncbi:MAG: NAD-dependent epimerase/dehydratase family protein [bacterium]|nr:NAD-dependent epimerase/dehydratase family protein [bacterium]